jgi:hypothetical protein
MNNHVTPERISKMLAGYADAEGERHAAACAECAAELQRVRDSLTGFRDSVRHWSDRVGGMAPSPQRTAPRARPMRWALAMAVIVVVMLVPL